jgi:hypothetical protein
MLLKRSVSPDGRIDSLSVEFSAEVDDMAALLFRWFLDLNWDEPSFDHCTFSRNRARLLEHDVAGEFSAPW